MFRIATEQGVLGHMFSTFSTKTLPNHHSIATGLYQETHGIIHNHMYDPLFGEHFSDDSNRWWNNFQSTPIYIANQIYDKHQRSSCCSPWIGCHATYHRQNYQTRYFRRFNRSSCFYEQFEWTLANMFRSDGPPVNLAMLYIHEPDMTAHRYGPFNRKTLKQVQNIDNFVGYINQRLKELNLSINLIILSDHGLCEIHPRRSMILDKILNTSCYEAYGSNPLFTIKIHPGQETLVYRTLTEYIKRWPSFRVYKKYQIPKRFRYGDHRRIQDLLILAEEGWSIYKTRQEWQLESINRGEHGYDNQCESMRPIFIARGPQFKQAFNHKRPFINVDLYPMLLKLLDIPSNQYYHQGNISNVEQMLQIRPK